MPFLRPIASCLVLLAACRPAAPTAPPTSEPPPAAEATASPSSSEPRAPREPEDLGPLLEPIVERMQVPGLGAAVVDREGLVAIGVVGKRHVDRPEPLQLDDRFHLGSDTKAMTAYVVGRLVDRGELAWDDTLAQLLPDMEIHPGLREVTVDQLLTQRAGLPPNADDDELEGKLDPQSTPAQQRAVVAAVALARKPAQAPGTFVYSNLGYIVLGVVLQERTGSSWEALLQRELFEPRGMSSCGFGPVATADAPDGTWAHERDERGGGGYQPVDFDNPLYLGPAGTVHCSLEDWGRFAQVMFDDGPGLEVATRQHLRTAVADDEHYARGWMVSDAFPLGEPILTHDGSNTLNYASIVIAPKRGLALMTVCNAGDAAAQGAVVDAMLTVMKAYGRPSRPSGPGKASR